MCTKLFLGFIATAALMSYAHAAEPWDRPFADDLSAVVAAARSVPAPADQSMLVLLEDHHYLIDREGRATSTIRKVYRILKEDAVEEWASVEQGYQPWYEQNPQIRARVIGN